MSHERLAADRTKVGPVQAITMGPLEKITPSGPQGTPGRYGFIAPPSSGGGIINDLLNAPHWLASKADIAAHDIAGIPGGLVQAGKGIAQDTAATLAKAGIGGRYGQDALQNDPSGYGNIKALGKALWQGAETSVEHPLRDPFQTALTLLPLANLAAGTVERTAAAADAIRAGDVAGAAKAVVTKPEIRPRVLNVPKVVGPEGQEVVTHEPVNLVPSKRPLMRLVHKTTDAMAQKALDRGTFREDQTLPARYAMKRVQGSLNETARISQRLSAVTAGMLDRAGAGRHAFDDGISQKEGQLAIFLRSNNVDAGEANKFWADQAANGINPAETGKLADLAQSIQAKGLLAKDEGGNVIVASRNPKLANVDALTKQGQDVREGIISRNGLMEKPRMTNRLKLVSKAVTGEARSRLRSTSERASKTTAPGRRVASVENDST